MHFHRSSEDSHAPIRNSPPQPSGSRVGTATMPPSGSKINPFRRNNTMQNREYVDMLLHLDTIPVWHNIVASLSTWLLLAGLVVLPGTFTSLKDIKSDNHNEQMVIERLKNTPLVWVAAICGGVGLLGMSALWIRWRQNYVWLINRIFLPGFLNSLAGLISTLVNIYTSQQGRFSVTAIVTTAVAGAATVGCLALWIFYNRVKLHKVQKLHRREYGRHGKGEETFMEKVRRKATEGEKEPGNLA